MSSSRTVLIYRDTILPPSETFVRNQAESLIHFTSHFICLRRVAGPPLPEKRVHLLCSRSIFGGAQRGWFQLFGHTPGQLRRLARCSPELIHAHFAPDAADVLPLARALRVPLVVSLHGYDVTSSDKNLTARYVRRRALLQRSAARFLCVSRFVRERALAAGFPADKTLLHYTGVDTQFFSPDDTIARVPMVLFVGRLVEGKGCEYLIRAMAAVQQVIPEISLVVIGGGPLREPLEQLATKTLHHCQFLGGQTPETVRHWMNKAMVLSNPSVRGRAEEGFGMVFAEAQAMGLPVVSSNIGGIPEVVSEGETGFLVPDRDAEALARKLITLLQDQDLWTKMSNAGRVRVCELFDLSRQALGLEQIYDDVTSEWMAKRHRAE